MSLISQIQEYAQQRPFEWFNGGELERLGMLAWVDEEGHHYKASNVSRRAREMADGKTREKVLDRMEKDGSVWYRYIPLMQRTHKEITHPSPEVARVGQQSFI